MGSGERLIPYGEGRNAIMQAAIRLVAREGLPKLTLRALAAEAGLSLGAVRHSFPTIDDVLAGVLEWSMEQSLRTVSAANSLPELLSLIRSGTLANPDRSAFEVKVLIEAPHRPGLMALADRYYAGFAEFTRAFLRDHGYPDDEATVEFVTAFVDGMNYQHVIFGGRDPNRLNRQIEGLSRLAAAELR